MVDGTVNPFYVAQPAPLGVADFGLGATPYSYNTTHILGALTLNAPPNATQPGGTGLIETSGGGLHQGYVGDEYEFGIQLNTLIQNVSIPGTNNGIFWTQNVVNVNDTGIHFVSDTFNFSLNSFAFIPQSGPGVPATILSGCTVGPSVNVVLDVYGGVYQCVAGVIPITPASYPITIQLYNNATINAQNDAQVAYGYRVIESGTDTVQTTVYNTVVFNNPNATAPSYEDTQLSQPPAFTISGTHYTPNICASVSGCDQMFFRDAEIVVVGGIGGDNSVFRAINGTINLEYSNLTAGGWQNVPSAYNFGGDTGETSTGIADFWTPSHTLEINQGPAMLYGLWNAEPRISVASGDIRLSGTIDPTYGFVFLGNVAPGARGTNLSWVPTTAAGTFNTYLPPVGAPWTTEYHVQAFADGFAEKNGTPVTAADASYALTLTSAPGTLNAPLYMLSNAQAQSLAENVSSWTSGPYSFSGLTVNVNYTFNHINEYGFPSFELFTAQGVTQPIDVNNTYQGHDSATGNYYILNSVVSGTTGIFAPAPSVTSSTPYYTSGIDIYDGVGDHVTNQSLFAVAAYVPCLTTCEIGVQGSEMTLWEDTNAFVYNTTATDRSPGVWVGDSDGTTILDLTASLGATGVTDLDSTGTTGSDLSASDGALGLEGLSSAGETFSHVNATNDAQGISTGADYGAEADFASYYYFPGTSGLSVNDLNVTNESLGANITLSSGTTLTDVSTYDPVDQSAGGIWLDAAVGTTVHALFANSAWGIDMWNATGTTITDYTLENADDVGSIWGNSSATAVTNLLVENYYVGIVAQNMADTSFTNVVISNAFLGLVIESSVDTSLTNVAVSSVAEVGVLVEDSMQISVTGIAANDPSVGLGLEDTLDATVTSVTATNESTGVISDGAEATDVTGVTASNESIGVVAYESDLTTVDTAAVSSLSVAVFSYDSEQTSITGVTASNSTLSSPFATTLSIGAGFVATLPAIAAVVTEDDQLDSISNIAATTYSAAFIDYDSYDPGVNNVTGTTSWYAVALYDTSYGVFTNLGAYQDYIGLYADDAVDNVITMSTFSGSSSYGVVLLGGVDNYVYDNSFIGNNGATGSYSAAHIQAYTDGDNYFYFEGIGNYWADWHTYNQYGSLAPYPLGDDNFDYYPLGGPEGTVAVYFYESGLASGIVWSVTLNGGTEATTNSVLVFYVLPGSYSFTSGDVTGYLVSPASGSVSASGAQVSEDLTYTAQYTVTIAETGLASGTAWSAAVGGTVVSGTTASLSLGIGSGTYAFQVAPVSGYTASPASGSITVGTSSYTLWVSFTPVTSAVTVTVAESGLAAGATWSATIGGVTASGTTSTLTFTVAPGTYAYQVSSAGYTASPSSGTVTPSSGTYNLLVSFTQVTYAVTFTESGLASGAAWSVSVNGETQSTVGTSITVYLPNGNYTYTISTTASGYSLAGGSGTVQVNGAPAGKSAAFTSTSGGYVTSNTYTTGFDLALIIAVIALVVGLLALLWRPRKPAENPPAPAPWVEPTGPSGTTGSRGSRSSSTGGTGTSGSGEDGPPKNDYS
jgi:hypothetical protein